MRRREGEMERRRDREKKGRRDGEKDRRREYEKMRKGDKELEVSSDKERIQLVANHLLALLLALLLLSLSSLSPLSPLSFLSFLSFLSVSPILLLLLLPPALLSALRSLPSSSSSLHMPAQYCHPHCLPSHHPPILPAQSEALPQLSLPHSPSLPGHTARAHSLAATTSSRLSRPLPPDARLRQ